MKHLLVQNPATGAAIAQVPTDDAASVGEKMVRARAAQPRWAALPLSDRLACIQRFRDAIEAETETLAATLTAEVGKPIRQSRNELNGLLGRLDFFVAEAASAIAPETVFTDAAITERIDHEALGVIANVSAWNYPYFIGANVFVPALLTGNAVLYKPSEYATLSGQHMARLLHDAGVPKDVFVTLIGAAEVGTALLAEPVDGVFFTGSVATGKKIAAAVGPRMIRLQLELGGKDPSYVADDADPLRAAESLADGAMYNSGQSCCSVERIYVHERIHDAFVAAFVDTVRGFTVGDPAREDTYIGNWFEPTVFSCVDHGMALMREESFGPIIGIQKVGGDAEALALMNDTRYGLTAGVYTPDASRARAILSRANAGSVYWNCCDRVSPRLPWSGHGDSGVGVTLSRYGIQAFTRPRAWHLRAP